MRVAKCIHKYICVNTIGGRWCAMCIIPFLRFYNFIKGIMHIYKSFLKNMRQSFLCFTH